MIFGKGCRARGSDGLGKRRGFIECCPTLNLFDLTGDTRAVVLIAEMLKRKVNA